MILLWTPPSKKSPDHINILSLLHPVTKKDIFSLQVQTPNIRANRCLITIYTATFWDNHLQVKPLREALCLLYLFPQEWNSLPPYLLLKEGLAPYSYSSQMTWWNSEQSTSLEPRAKKVINTRKGRPLIVSTRLSRSNLATAWWPGAPCSAGRLRGTAHYWNWQL